MSTNNEQDEILNDWDIKIKRAVNGIIIKDEDIISIYEVEDDKKRVIEMLYCLLDMMCLPNQKYDKDNIEIRLVHGRGYECDGCGICKGNDYE